MTIETWVVATGERRIAAMVAAARALGGRVTVFLIGQRSIAEAAAAAGPDAVRWIEPADDVPAEAYAPALVALSAARPRVVLATSSGPDRVLLGSVAVAIGAALIPGVTRVALEGDAVVVDRTDLGGRVVETLRSAAPVAGLFVGDDAVEPVESAPAPIERLDDATPFDIASVKTARVSGADSGIASAQRVVAVGRGLKTKADLPLVEGLAATLGAALGCSMPVADDLGWVPKDRYIGRSGQHISPRLYVAVGISGAAQHLDGVRDAKVVVAINSDPAAHIFRRAAYGIVGDLYEVIPALQDALSAYESTKTEEENDHGGAL